MNFRIEKKESFKIMGLSGYENGECKTGDSLTTLWREFMDNYNFRLWNGGGTDNYTRHLSGRLQPMIFSPMEDGTKVIIGAEYKGKSRTV